MKRKKPKRKPENSAVWIRVQLPTSLHKRLRIAAAEMDVNQPEAVIALLNGALKCLK